ncbi:MAG TPA: DeoR/GlpR family DNA-binding transcription regulator [Actinomycetota bacterium]
MLSAQRRELVLRAVQSDQASRVTDLADMFDVSEMTIRRDLDTLADLGKLTRVHGGAVADGQEPPFEQTADERSEEKARIGAAAADMVGDGETIILDIGTTTLQVARHLRGRRLTVVTSNLAVYEELRDDTDVELVLLGGAVRRNYRSMVGFLAEDALRQIRADRAFLGASGLRWDLSVMDSTMMEVPIKRGMMAAATESVLLIDSAKLGVGGNARVCGADDMDALVTDTGAPPTLVGALEDAGVRVVQA